jgi:hypothetical protein
MTPPAGPPVVRVDVVRLHGRAVPRAAARTVLDRSRLRSLPGLRFARVLGTGDARTMSPARPTPRRWLLLTVWDRAPGGESPPAPGWPAYLARWDRSCAEHGWLQLHPLASRGRWSGRTPFGDPDRGATKPAAARAGTGRPTALPPAPSGPGGRRVAALTRARLRPARLRAFLAAVPEVAADLHRSGGLRYAVGVGEAPLGWQGTFSVWDDDAALRRFAYHRPAHAAVIGRTPVEGWYAEELFARFTVTAGGGSFDGLPAGRLVEPDRCPHPHQVPGQ